MKVFVFLNPLAGDFSTSRNFKKLNRLLKNSDFEPRFFFSDYKNHIKEAISDLKEEIRKDYECIIVIGGDGTISETFSGMAGANLFDIPVGIVPMGTGNDFARTINIPLNFPKFALEVIRAGRTMEIDIGNINGSFFVNYIGFGFDGQVVTYKALQKTILPKRLSYIRPILRALKSLERYKFKLRIDGKEEFLEGINLIITNIPSYSSGIRLYPEAKVDDKIFEITFLKKMPKAGNLALLPIMHSRILRQDNDIVQFQASELEIKFPEDVPSIQVDGDMFNGESKDFKISLLPDNITVFCNL